MAGSWDQFAQEFRRGGWRPVVVSAIGHGLGVAVLPFYTLGAFVGPLQATYGWSRAEIQSCLIFVVAATLAGGWGTGWLTDRFGVKPVAAWSQLGFGIAIALLAATPDHLGFWYGMWFFMALVGLGTSPIGWTRSIAAWFDGGRGMALALALSGSGICAMIAPGIAAQLIEDQGWRFAYAAIGGTVLLVGLPLTLFLMPRDPGVSSGPIDVPSSVAGGLTVQEALTGYRFWLLLASLVIAGFAVSGLIPNLVPLMVDRGIAPTVAAGTMGMLGVSIILGRLLTGFALDRLWAPIVACMVVPLPGLGCLILAGGTSDYATLVACITVLGFAVGAEFDLAPYMVTRYFGVARYSQIYALQWITFTAAAGMAPAIVGHIYDATGNYNLALYICAALFLIAPLILLFLGPYPIHFNSRERGAEGNVARMPG